MTAGCRHVIQGTNYEIFVEIRKSRAKIPELLVLRECLAMEVIAEDGELQVYKNTRLTMASSNRSILTFFVASAISNINVAQAVRHLLQLPPLPYLPNFSKLTCTFASYPKSAPAHIANLAHRPTISTEAHIASTS
ncbi:hypothetical protein OIU79_024563 [Salix purpurea]|uniref:Uncharacterized protein n=1 Tax=Salix purpurea TaxID=77065 RepID=A0A9Q0WB54_SALPP|nr:hypothetical protein OIU79_024563 [Salix purpurea]